MGADMTVGIGGGVINLRVGAIILKDHCVLMVRNTRDDWFYSVGGRIQFGETAEQAIVREVMEETNVRMEIDRLGFVCESYFNGTLGDGKDQLIYELCFYYYMKTPEGFEPHGASFTADGVREFLEWVPFDTPKTVYPEFFRTELRKPVQEIRHIVADERHTI